MFALVRAVVAIDLSRFRLSFMRPQAVWWNHDISRLNGSTVEFSSFESSSIRISRCQSPWMWIPRPLEASNEKLMISLWSQHQGESKYVPIFTPTFIYHLLIILQGTWPRCHEQDSRWWNYRGPSARFERAHRKCGWCWIYKSRGSG